MKDKSTIIMIVLGFLLLAAGIIWIGMLAMKDGYQFATDPKTMIAPAISVAGFGLVAIAAGISKKVYNPE